MPLEHPTVRVRVGTQPAGPPPDDGASAAFETQRRETYTPPIDIHEAPEGLTLEADLPGASERNLNIQLEDNVLNLYAKVDAPAPDGARPVHEEYRLGDYHRSFILSDEVDRERITAELNNGVLRLFLPKAERAGRAELRSKRPKRRLRQASVPEHVDPAGVMCPDGSVLKTARSIPTRMVFNSVSTMEPRTCPEPLTGGAKPPARFIFCRTS